MRDGAIGLIKILVLQTSFPSMLNDFLVTRYIEIETEFSHKNQGFYATIIARNPVSILEDSSELVNDDRGWRSGTRGHSWDGRFAVIAVEPIAPSEERFTGRVVGDARNTFSFQRFGQFQVGPGGEFEIHAEAGHGEVCQGGTIADQVGAIDEEGTQGNEGLLQALTGRPDNFGAISHPGAKDAQELSRDGSDEAAQ